MLVGDGKSSTSFFTNNHGCSNQQSINLRTEHHMTFLAMFILLFFVIEDK